VLAIVRTPATDLARLPVPSDPLILVAEDVEKPGNLGAILRSADGAGADAVIAASPRTDLFNPNTIRASLGTIFAVPLAAAPTDEVIAWLRQRGIRIVAARVDATRLATESDLTGPLAIAVGAEAEGLSSAWSAAGIEAVRLPMLGVADSLNVAAASAVLLYEARRQRGLPGPRSSLPAVGG
jgi:TrmH family RNA methyltransferase